MHPSAKSFLSGRISACYSTVLIPYGLLPYSIWITTTFEYMYNTDVIPIDMQLIRKTNHLPHKNTSRCDLKANEKQVAWANMTT